MQASLCTKMLLVYISLVDFRFHFRVCPRARAQVLPSSCPMLLQPFSSSNPLMLIHGLPSTFQSTRLTLRSVARVYCSSYNQTEPCNFAIVIDHTSPSYAVYIFLQIVFSACIVGASVMWAVSSYLRCECESSKQFSHSPQLNCFQACNISAFGSDSASHQLV